MQTNVQGKEKEGNATKCCISPHFSTDLKFCLHQGWSVEKAVQHLWKCASTECWKAHSTTFLSWLHIISIRLIAIRSFGSCYLRTRFVRCTCIQGTKMQTNVQDKEKEGNRHEVMHFFALLNRFKVLPASRVKCWKSGATPMEMCLKRMLEDTLNNVFQSIA